MMALKVGADVHCSVQDAVFRSRVPGFDVWLKLPGASDGLKYCASASCHLLLAVAYIFRMKQWMEAFSLLLSLEEMYKD